MCHLEASSGSDHTMPESPAQALKGWPGGIQTDALGSLRAEGRGSPRELKVEGGGLPRLPDARQGLSSSAEAGGPQAQSTRGPASPARLAGGPTPLRLGQEMGRREE